jgi:hypothetical protein
VLKPKQIGILIAVVLLVAGVRVVPAQASIVKGIVNRGGRTAGTPTVAPRPAKAFGVSIQGLPQSTTQLQSFEGLVGRNVSIADWYDDFTTPNPTFFVTSVAPTGAENMVAWEGYDANARSDGVTDRTTSLATIIDGRWDGLLTTWARALKASGQPVLLRFLPEMNGNWNPTSEGVNGNTAGQFARAWIHAHNIFAAAGASNVRWVWNVNVDYRGSTPLKGLYPGDAYVDYVGIDGYNWGTSQSWSTWQTPEQVFTPTLADVSTFTRKPVIICETASSERGGNKAQWIQQLFAFVESTPAITGFAWFEFNKETNWLVNSSPSALAAFRTGLQGY